ncbi:hypothetical protein LUZ63_002711 [Rhynchospora breviuscula]|uniref:Ribosomal protein L19 n=1 Tax=Rhynchospora breviuscula TaxID=2022672 RepID=A0A9Q0CZ86_9POAL|nr:hypothetical protein LUZ63_002711 [Rhynchospora breviuscula]
MTCEQPMDGRSSKIFPSQQRIAFPSDNNTLKSQLRSSHLPSPFLSKYPCHLTIPHKPPKLNLHRPINTEPTPMASSSLLPHSLLSLPTASSRFPKSSLTISSISFSLNQVSITRTGSVAFQPLVRRGRESTFRIARAGETGEEETPAETGGNASTTEIVEEESSVAVAVEEKPPKKPIVKLNEIIGILNKQAIEEAETIKPVPDIRPGDIVEIKKEKANRRRLALYKGIVISKSSAGVHTTIRIRYMTSGTAVEIVFPVYSPKIKEIKVVSHRDVRRAKLYYLREKLPRFYTFKKK